MRPTVDVEITSKSTARATLADAEVPPMKLEATEGKTIGAVVHEFLHQLAQEHDTVVEVVVRTEKGTAFRTVHPDGTAAESAPSMPLPIVTTTTPAPVAAEPVSAPVMVAADPIGHDVALDPIQVPIQAASRPAAAPTPSPVGQRPAAPTTGPITGPLNVFPQLSAPRADPESSDPARLGLRGRVNAVLGLKLAPKTDSLEMRLRGAQTTIARPLPEGAVVTFANIKGGVGKSPMAIALAEGLAEHRGPATVSCLDLGEVGGSFADRVAVPPTAGQDVLSLLAGAANDARPTTLGRYMTRQPSGSDIIAGRAEAQAPLSYEDAAALSTILSRHRDLVVVDTGNSTMAGSWQWATDAAHAVVVPLPMRRDAAKGAQHTLAAIAAKRPDLLARTVVVITDGPGDAPMVETEAVDALSALGVQLCRMPFEPLFASGERIAYSQLRGETRAALTVLGATVVGLMTGVAMG
ncbi:MinD-like ATPase involved in chromosome partitioning or flagellar assembly [Rhodococcus sp. PvR044]|uniref:ParA family protein n=1 Tax=Rhodococcus sp. PvR044 TaxID=3156402 RepID=UPI00339428DC